MKVLVTGYEGLIGTHMHALLEAKNCAARFHGSKEPFDIYLAGRREFADLDLLSECVQESHAVFHLAGVNRGTKDEVAQGNQKIAQRLIEALRMAGAKPHVVYSNSTHCSGVSDYGVGKHQAAELLSSWAQDSDCGFSNLILPHVFGEGGRPFYNSVTATLCYQIAKHEQPEINAEGAVELVHAGVASQAALDCYLGNQSGTTRVDGVPMSVLSLYDKLQKFYQSYTQGSIPDLTDQFDVKLFNTLRSGLFPVYYPSYFVINKDERGELFEAVKGGAGQVFLSWTKPGVTRGNHFHLGKIERFAVVSGEATIRVRHIFEDTVHEFNVTGENPSYVDMPTLHTHSIENTGQDPLLTLFWANEIFNPESPDTYAMDVLKEESNNNA